MGFKAVNEVAEARKAKKQRAAFYTPLELVDQMVEAAGVHGESRCLEPSAGDGRIVHALEKAGVDLIHACEIEPTLHPVIKKLGGILIGGDFLEMAAAPPLWRSYDAVIMNPPFKGKEWLKHLEHAWKFLKKGGRLVAVLPDSARELILSGKIDLKGCDLCNFDKINPKAFKDYETSIPTILVIAHNDDEIEHTKVEGFKNHVTYSVAITIASTSEIYARRETITDEEIRQEYLKSNRDGGHCDYGIDWKEVYDYLRVDLWRLDGKVPGKGVGKGKPVLSKR